jgi:RecA/RadA recombinase
MATKKNNPAEPDFSFFKKIKTGDRYADANVFHPEYGYVDSGSYMLNALLCGDIFGGFHLNRFFMAAGEQGSGKSYMMKNNFIKPLMDMGYFIYYYDTEHETSESQLIEENGFNPDQFTLVQEHTTAEDVFVSIAELLDTLEADKGKKMKNERKVAFVLDSLGGMTTKKTTNDATKGELKQDMTKAKVVKAMFTNITNRCGNLGIPMFITNHIYMATDGYGDPKRIANGEGAKYFASVILTMRKTYDVPDKNTKEIKGIILEATVYKSRMVKPKKTAMLYLDYDNGLNRYYGLHNVAIEAGLIEEFSASKYPALVEKMPKDGNGQKTRKTCYVIKDPKKKPEDWIVCLAAKSDRKEYVGTILEEINEYVKKEYKFRPPALGASENEAPEVDDEVLDDAIEDMDLADAAKAENLRKAVNGDN